jgi:hypothetical protein
MKYGNTTADKSNHLIVIKSEIIPDNRNKSFVTELSFIIIDNTGISQTSIKKEVILLLIGLFN